MSSFGLSEAVRIEEGLKAIAKAIAETRCRHYWRDVGERFATHGFLKQRCEHCKKVRYATFPIRK